MIPSPGLWPLSLLDGKERTVTPSVGARSILSYLRVKRALDTVRVLWGVSDDYLSVEGEECFLYHHLFSVCFCENRTGIIIR